MKKFFKYFILVSILCYIGIPKILAANESTLYSEVCGVEDIPASLPIFVSNIVKLLKILVPIILVIMGMIDFARATIASDEKQMKESQSRFIRRVLAAVIVFLVIAVIQFIFSTISTNNKMTGCLNCFINGKCNVVVSESACYVCSDNENLKLWTGTNPGKTSNCSNGYTRTDLPHESCGIMACYQCNYGDHVKWAINGDADDTCTSYHQLYDITTQSECTEQTCRGRVLHECNEQCHTMTGSYTSQEFMSCADTCTSHRYASCEE